MSSKLTQSIVVKGDVSKIYKIWANFENFPNFMKNIKSVEKIDANRSHWVMEGPLGKDLKWDAQMTELDPNKRIAWNSMSGNIKTSGQVTFNELPAGETQVTVMMQYTPPGGKVGDAVSHMIGHPEEKLNDDLRCFKTYAEMK